MPNDYETLDEYFLRSKRQEDMSDAEALVREMANEGVPEGERIKDPTAPQPRQTDKDLITGPGLEMLGNFALDVGHGIIESPGQVLGGARDAVDNTLQRIDDLAMWLGTGGFQLFDEEGNFRPELLSAEELEGLRAEGVGGLEEAVPEVPEAESVTGGGIRAISQFLTGFIPAIKTVRGVTGGIAASRMGQFAQAEAAAGIASALVFDPHEERLSNVIESVPTLSNPVTEFLAADEDDSTAEGMVKNTLEGFGLGAVAEGFIRGLRAVRANRIEKGVEPSIQERALAEPDESIIAPKFGDPAGPAIAPEQLDALRDMIVPGKAFRPESVTELPFEMNWAAITDEEGFERTVRSVAKVFTEQIDEARRGTITETETRKLADSLGMTPEELLNRRQGQAFNAEEIVASRMVLNAATSKLQELARTAARSSDPADSYALMRMANIHMGIQAQFQGAASEAGRALRALQIPAGSREKQINEISQMLMGSGGGDKVRQLAQAMSEVNNADDVAAAVRGSFGKRTADALVEWWYFALLSGPQTHAVNVTSSALNSVWQIPERALAAQFSKLRGGGGVETGEATEMFYGLVSSLGDAFRTAGRAAWEDTPSDVFGKVEARVQRAITSENFGFRGEPGSVGRFANKAIDGFGAMVRMPSRALMAEDEFYRTIGRSMGMRSIALRTAKQEGLEGKELATRVEELMHNPTEAMKEESIDFARGLTWTTPLGPTGRTFQTAINRHPSTKFVLPFVRTPTNLLKWAGKRTPLGLLSKDIRQQIAKGGPEGDLALARMVMGSSLMLLTADLAMKGLVTGSGPTDQDLRRVWMQDKQPFSVKVGDTWYSYNRGDPFGLLMGAAASLAEVSGEASYSDSEELATALAIAASRSITNKTWLSGPAEFMEAMHNPERGAKRWLQKSIGTFLVPTGAAQINRSIEDPVLREVESIREAIISRIPGRSEELPPRRNLWGEKILLEGGLGPDIVSPIYKFGEKDRPIDEWILENRAPVSMPSRTRGSVEMTPQQYDRYVELAGNELKDPLTGKGLYDTLNAMIEGKHPQSYRWRMATDGPEGGRSKILKGLVREFRDAAWGQLLQEDPELLGRVEAKMLEERRALRETIMDPRAGERP